MQLLYNSTFIYPDLAVECRRARLGILYDCYYSAAVRLVFTGGVNKISWKIFGEGTYLRFHTQEYFKIFDQLLQPGVQTWS